MLNREYSELHSECITLNQPINRSVYCQCEGSGLC